MATPARVPVVTTIFYPAIAAAWVGWILAALMVGLWLGERGRRRAAERLLTFGNPEDGSLKKPVSRAPSGEAEDRFLASATEVSKETVERAVVYLKSEAKRQGIEGMSDAQFERDARSLLAGQNVEP